MIGWAVLLTAASASASASASPSELPMGHPAVAHRSARSPGMPQIFQPPPDTEDEDATVVPGSIVVELRDAGNNLVPGRTVDLGILQQSVAKGESRKHVSQGTGSDGKTTFEGLERGGNVAYRVTVHDGDAVFAARPFQLNHEHGMHVVLHVYPVTSDFAQDALIITRSIVYLEMKDDRVQIQQRVDVFNGSPVAWVPHDVVLKLPDGFTALTGMQQMSDTGIDTTKEGARLHGTFGPGENAVLFNWQLPYAATPEIEFDLGMPPNLGQLVVRAASSPGMKLSVPGFPDAVSQVNEEGQRELVTTKRLEEGQSPLRKVHVALSGLPTPGPERWIATGLALVGVLAGIAAYRQRSTGMGKAGMKRDRARLLELLSELETARDQGDIGPKTYERARRELIDELAGLLAQR